MSGHSKWSQIKYKKGIKDVRRGKLFSKLSKAITVAARSGSDPEMNSRLRMAIDQARSANVPAANIERAIKRGTGEIEGVTIEEGKIEAYGPGGIAILIKILTDNKNRTLAEIKNILTKNDGKIAGAGAVAYLFQTKGEIRLAEKSHQPLSEEEIEERIIDSGADDYVSGEPILVYTKPGDLSKVQKKLRKEKIDVESAKLVQEAKDLVRIEDKKQAEKIIELMNKLEEHEDVEEVYSNFDIPEELVK